MTAGHSGPREPQPPPPKWASDSLSEFIELAHRNRFATFVHKKASFCRLANIDALFVRIANDWRDPPQIVPPLLFLRCHSAFRAACEHALAGQVTDGFPQVRAVLEYAGYALHIHKNPWCEELWTRRHDDDDALRAVRREFHMSKVAATIAASNSHTSGVFDHLYQRTIDFGAHPNERAVSGNLAVREFEDRKEIQQSYLHGDSPQLDHILKTSAQAGVCALEIFSDVFKQRFDLLGVSVELPKLRIKL